MCDDYPWRQWDRKGVIEKPLDGNGHRGAPKAILGGHDGAQERSGEWPSGRKEGPMRTDSRWEWGGFTLGWAEEEMLTFLREEGLGAPAGPSGASGRGLRSPQPILFILWLSFAA